MIFIAKADGSLSRVIPSAVNQGSVGVNELVLIAPYPKGSAVTAAFILPNGIRTKPNLATLTEIADFIEGEHYNAWVFELTAAITEYAGNVTVQFYVTSANGVLTTYSDTFSVAKGAMPEPPEEITEEVYNQILTAYGEASARLSTAESDISSIKADIGADYTYGTIKGRIYAAEMNTRNNESEITQTKSRVSTNESDISEIEKEIGDDGEASSIKGRINTAEVDIDDLERRTGNLEDKASEFESDFVIVDGRLVSLEGSASAAATAISALQTSLKNFGIFNRAEYNKTTNTIILWFVKNGEDQKVEIPLEDFLNSEELEDEIAAKISALAKDYVDQAKASASNASASKTAAETAKTAAESAAKKAEGHATSASASASAAEAARESAMREASTAGSMAMDASSYATQAKASADKAEMYSQTSEDRWSVFDKRLTNVENGISADPFVTDDTVAYQKTAPASALPFAAIERVGGMSSVIDGTLHHAAVTGIESAGKNLFDNGNINAYSGIGIAFQTFGEYVRLNGTKGSGSNIIAVSKPNLVLPAGTYALSIRFISGTLTRTDTTATDDSIMFGINSSGYGQRTSGAVLKVGDVGRRIFTITEPTAVATFDITPGYSGTGNIYDNVVVACQLERAGAVTDFEPYYNETFHIPEAVQALPYYGYGINADVNNHIDYENTEYVQMCSVRAYQSGDENNPEVVTDGTRTVYALTTPVRTPITFTDNYIRVGGSGTLTFVNEHKMAVPSTVLYLTKEATV